MHIDITVGSCDGKKMRKHSLALAELVVAFGVIWTSAPRMAAATFAGVPVLRVRQCGPMFP